MNKLGIWRGTGKSTLETKNLHQIAGIWKEVLYDIIVDIHKAYGVLDQGCALAINRRVRGGPPGLTTHYPLLVLGHHGGRGERLLWVPLREVPWCHPGETTFPSDN